MFRGEQDLRAVGVVPCALFGVGKDLVSVEQFLEGGGGCSSGDARVGGGDLVRVELESEAPVSGADLIGGAIA